VAGVGGEFEGVDLVGRELVRGALVPVRLAVQGVVVQAELFDALLPS
jgi:chromosome condensin MukBEF MukE localization factor